MRLAHHYLFATTVPPREPVEALVPDEGPDDLWPSEPVAEEATEVTVQQWGLRLPDDTVAWGNWQNVPFDHPLGRMRMIATLQQTALNMGFAEGDQVADFLSHYGWATRDARVRTHFSDITGTFALGDPVVAEVTTNGSTTETEVAGG